MPNGANGIDPAKTVTVNALVSQLGSLLTALLAASRATTDDTVLLQINNEYSAVQTLLSQATQAQVAANTAAFTQSATQIKSQADMLQGMETHISDIVSDVALAGQIAGYIAQAITLIARL